MSDIQRLSLSDLRPGSTFRQYHLLEQIGVGGQGVVWSAQDPAKDRIVAIKLNEVIETGQQKVDDQIFERQASHLVSLRHPFILPMYEYGLSEQIRYLVTPYVPGGSLEEKLRIGALEIHSALQYAAKIAAALDYLHGENVVHRDLKPGNILIDYSQNVYVADFGLARVLSFSTQSMHTGRGTPPYAPPEQHAMGEMALQADIYSFGMMLYEMFTGQLPWKAEKILGIEQLHSPTEIPDPTEINPGLPNGLVTILRQLTAANPAARPASAGDAMQSLYATFRIAPIPVDTQNAPDDIRRHEYNAEHLLQNSLERWEPQEGTVVLSLTKFAYLELTKKNAQAAGVSADMQRFMLHNALIFGHDDDLWWAKVSSPKERLWVAGRLISRDNPAITARVVRHLVNDPAIRRMKFSLAENMARLLLQQALTTNDPAFQQLVFQFIQIYTAKPAHWRPVAFSDEQDRMLAEFSLRDSPASEAAARLIAHVRSERAIQAILESEDEGWRTDLLLAIQKTAGSLPGSVPLNTRLGTTGEAISRRLTDRPFALVSAYLAGFVGMALSVTLQVYLTYRLPNFMDLERFTVSIERGLFLGAALGLGVFLVKLVVEGFPEAGNLARVAIASIVGGATLTIVLSLYDALFLQTLPGGPIVFVGCLLLACGLALAGLTNRRGLKMLVAYLAFVSALAGTWFGHASLGNVPATMSPIFFYEYSWPATQVIGTILIVALPMAVAFGLTKLSLTDE